MTRRSAEGDEGTARCMECEIGDAFERKGAGRNGAGGFARKGAMQSSEVRGGGRRRFALSNGNGVGASSLWQFPATLLVDHKG